MNTSISKLRLLITAVVGLHFFFAVNAERIKDLSAMETGRTHHALEYSFKSDKTSGTQFVLKKNVGVKDTGKLGWLTRALLLSPLFFL